MLRSVIYIIFFLFIIFASSCNIKRGSGCGCPTFGMESPVKDNAELSAKTNYGFKPCHL